METFIYKCPNCGGKVNYVNNQWHCDYCGNNYAALFETKEEKELPKYERVFYTLYSYTCPNCNRRVITTKEDGFTCSSCNQEFTGQGKPFRVANILTASVSIGEAKEQYERDIKKYDRSLFSNDLKLQFINCDLYNGYVKLSYGSIIEKYIFINFLIPNIEYEDYRFMYELGNIGLVDSKILNVEKRIGVCSTMINYQEYINSTEDINYENDIINECINDFAKKHGISDLNSIKMTNNFQISDGVYIPMYMSKSLKGNEPFYQYVFGNRSMSIMNKTFMTNKKSGNTIIELPKKDNAHKKARMFNTLYQLLHVIMFFAIGATFMFLMSFIEAGIRATSFGYKFLLIAVITLIVTSILGYICYKKYNFYEKSIQLTKEEYFDQIINNSNYVKVIKVKR